jgi:hypothetical protein
MATSNESSLFTFNSLEKESLLLLQMTDVKLRRERVVRI